MLKRRPARLLLLAAATVPLAAKTPYLARAWASSPVDRAHLGLYGALALVLAGAAAAAMLRWRFPAGMALARSRALKLAILPCVLYVAGIAMDVNALQLASSIAIIWAAAWALCGRAAGIMLAPAAPCAVLAVPGVLYWAGNAYAAFAVASNPAYAPEFDVDSQNGMFGREEPADAVLFRTGKARQFRYESISNAVSVLCVAVGDDIHEIHPATHCLRSHGWRIVSEKIVSAAGARDGAEFEVTEAVADSIAGRILVWTWYSDDDRSTGSFLHFRRLCDKSGRWRTYQVSTAIGPGGKEEAARRLAGFLRNK